jgi:hypothetical protein
MDDSRRARVADLADDKMSKVDGGEADAAKASVPSAGASTNPPANRPSAKPPAFVGHAMKSLFESADVSIRRDDETRVMSRAQDAIADLQKRKGIVIESSGIPGAASKSAPPASMSSAPPGPRVDVVLWVVLAAGLFAIAGWMLLYGL